MDEKDKQILEILKKNAKLSTQQISKKTLIPITTVHNRIKKLEREGVIRGYTVRLNYSKLGKQLNAYILITVDYGFLKKIKMTQHELVKKLKSHPAVVTASMITGEHDIVLRIRVSNMKEMNEFVTTYLRNIQGVAKSQTMVILNEH